MAASIGVANRRRRRVSSHERPGHRVTRRWRALYQFMNTETARLSVR